MRKAQAFVETHRHQRITVEQVTRAVGSNRVTLGKHFQRELDTTLQEYLRRRRLDFAAEHLRQGDVNVEEVAFQCGSSSTSYFSRLFRRHRPAARRIAQVAYGLGERVSAASIVRLAGVAGIYQITIKKASGGMGQSETFS